MKNNKIKIMVSIIILVILLFAVFMYMLYFNNDIPKKKHIKKELTITKNIETNRLSMVMVGDCLIHRFVYQDALNFDGNYSFSKMFTEVSDLIKNHDLAYYNQESNIGGKSLGLSAYPRFNSPEEIGDDMVDLGFNMVSLANNHTMDKGEIGVINSVNYWKTKPGVYYTGQALSDEDRKNNIKVLKLNGIKYAFFSYTTVTNGLTPPNGKEYLTNVYNYEKAKNDIESVRQEADFIIVAMHWGDEYTSNPNNNQKQIAKELSSLGANLIIGNHAHSIQSIEMIDDTLVFYALGNFISAQDTIDKQTGVIISLDVEKKDKKIIFNNIKANLIYTYFKGSSNFKIYPYNKLNDNILFNYQKYYYKYRDVLTKNFGEIEVQ